MKTQLFKFTLIVALGLFSLVSFSKGVITGTIVDGETGETLIGASLMVEGTTVGTVTDFDGKFKLPVEAGSNKIVISYIGFVTKTMNVTVKDDQTKDLGSIKLDADAVGINEVMVLASVAIQRETPVAVSSIQPKLIERKLGTQEYPEILKSTPGIYATKSGGGYGDARVNIRGFDSRNVGVMINGVPVNDMENGWVYWSNWAGLADVTRSMQVQRGLGASKVAVPSIGGTINVLTKTTDIEKGGNIVSKVGNDGYRKTGITLSTGLTENDLAMTFSLAKATGDGFVDGTEFESYSYFFNLSKRLNEKHQLSFSIFGAPQWHGQRTSELFIDEYKNNEREIKYNKDWGYKNGEVAYVRKNFYHKPQAILNHFWDVNDRTQVMTALYGSIGTGGGTGPLGEGKFYNEEYIREGEINFDKIVDENIESSNNGFGSESIIRASVNNHSWWGALSTVRHNDGNFDYTVGLDARYYKGEHYREVDDLLGGDFYLDDSNFNNPTNAAKHEDKVAYYNDGLVWWQGLFLQAEYKKDELSAFVSATISNKSYKRVDYFNYFEDDVKAQLRSNSAMAAEYLELLGEDDYNQAFDNSTETDWASFIGFSFKGGANYNIDARNNVFVNTGYFERQPDFRSVYLNYLNVLNEDAVNEKILSFELGYGYKSSIFSANINTYWTKWGDKSFTRTYPTINPVTGEDETYNANILGVDAVHMGVELDFVAKPAPKLDINGMLSIGSWKWANDINNVGIFDENQNLLAEISLFIEDVHVGDAAQTTAALGVNYELIKDLTIGLDYNYYARVFADFDPLNRTTKEGDTNPDSWEMPDYGVFDANLYYQFDLNGFDAAFSVNVNNLLDTEFVYEGTDGSDHSWRSATIYPGFGRTWSLGLKLFF